MDVFVFTKNTTVLKKAFPKNTQFFPLAHISKQTPPDECILYIDITGFDAAKIKKTITELKKSCKKTPWGIIDPKEKIKDPFILFFEGASDYLGSDFFKKSKCIDPKRIKQALLWRKSVMVESITAGKDNEKKPSAVEGEFLKNKIKLPAANIFPGWKKMPSGKVLPFYILFCSLQGKTALDVRLGEKAFLQLQERFLSFLADSFEEMDGLLWIDTGKDCAFLLPPKVKSIEAAIEACVRMIISAPLVTLETLGLSIPANFIFALHYGSITYKPRGKTGTVVSDAVNFIFHLGTKKAKAGRLTVSGSIPDESIPKILQDLFVFSGEFEGQKTWHTKKFSYANLWM